MLSCKRVSQLVSRSFEEKLSLWTRMQLWMHFGMCGICARLRKTMKRIQRESKARAEEIENGSWGEDLELSDSARKRIEDRMNSEG